MRGTPGEVASEEKKMGKEDGMKGGGGAREHSTGDAKQQERRGKMGPQIKSKTARIRAGHAKRRGK